MTRGARVDGPYEMATDHLAALGQLWLDGGRWQGQQLADPAFLAAMVRPHSAGGPPEDCAYGLLTWVAADHFFAGGWAGQHVVVVPPDWRPALQLVRAHLLAVLRGS